MYKIIALMGKAGAGKDRMMQAALTRLQNVPNIHEIISCTSRPIREGEANGINYYYYTPDQFMQKIFDGEMLEFTNFNNWWYGTSYDSVRSDGMVNIGVFNPAGVRSLLDRDDCDVIIAWVQAADKTRLLRQLNREEHPDVNEIIRRYQTDTEDFKEIDFSHYIIPNETWDDFNQGVETIVGWVQTSLAQGQD